MKINLEKLLRKEVDSLDLNFVQEIDTINYQGKDFKFTSPAKIEGRISRVHGDLYLDCKIEFSSVDTCGRCLKDIDIFVNADVQGFLVESEEEVLEDEDTFVYNGEELDFKEIVENAFILNVPRKVLCDEDCKGMCVNCGVNLNEAECRCIDEDENQEFIDPRLSKLKDFFKNN
ncbi:YceD family protein [Alkalithermobacter paradoxus]|uniref:Large ribosomal RNA subunit accumulation protein YceD n=1 Tax=Alkalithermobacter paradoxus TaxID=29349 RepID=A0A1V4IAG6_9FIRM|nr:hypothetical protein CLOTH_02080 [[Clostridium] thermoalcaliphilum]